MGNYKRNENNIKDSNQCGIYSITNLINGKRYIGQTYNFKYRWMRHRSYLKHGSEHNAHLQSAWNKYGADNFKFEIIEQCKFEDLDEREIYWINFYDSKSNGYNFADGGLGCKGYKHTPEEIAKMRMIQNPRPIVMLDLEGNYKKTFVSAGEAASFLGKESASGIKRCCDKDRYKKAYGYIWVYEDDYNNETIDWNYYFSKPKNSPKKIVQTTLEGTVVNVWKSIASIHDFSSSMIGVKLAKGFHEYKGFNWYYEEDWLQNQSSF